MKTDTSVKYFHSGMAGAPVLKGTPGATLAVLDACLVTGWGLKAVDSLVVAGNVATANISTGHAVQAGTVVLIAGATPAALNGEWRATSVTTNTVEFATEGVTDQTATGSITIKIAPAGWDKAFSGADIAAYRPTDPASSRMYLRVNDTATTTCQVVGYETMSSVDVGAALFPTAAQKTTGLWWQKSNTADTAARPWFVVSDGALFYYGKAYFSSMPTVFDIGVFGDFLSVKSVDPFACALFGRGDSSVAAPLAGTQFCTSESSFANLFTARSYSGLGASVQMSRASPMLVKTSSAQNYSGKAYGTPYPNPADGGLYLSPLNLLEGQGDAPAAMRGVFPGYYCCPQIIADGTFGTGDPVVGVSTLPGRTLISVQSYYTTVPANQTSFIDITGPWR